MSDGVWSLTICLVPEAYPEQKHPKSVDTHMLEYVPSSAEPGVALDGLIEQAKEDTSVSSLENDHIAWCQLSYHKNQYTFDESDADWSYSYQFQRATKVWRVKPFHDALEAFRRMVNREAAEEIDV